MKKYLTIVMSAVLVFCLFPLPIRAEGGEWVEEDGLMYWVEDGWRKGTDYDPECIKDRNGNFSLGREIYDPAEDAWYWLDSAKGGARAEDTQIHLPYCNADEEPFSTEGKTVYYDSDGKRVHGWHVEGKNAYYYDPSNGALQREDFSMHGVDYKVDAKTGRILAVEHHDVPYITPAGMMQYRFQTVNISLGIWTIFANYLGGKETTSDEMQEMIDSLEFDVYREVSKRYHLPFQGHLTYDDMIASLKKGMMVMIITHDGHFNVDKEHYSYNFIIAFGLDERERAMVYDLTDESRNRWHPARHLYEDTYRSMQPLFRGALGRVSAWGFAE